MAAGEREIIDATDEVILLVGDSQACSFSINGIVAHQAGKAGQPATLRITRQNYWSFLNPAATTADSGASSAQPGTSPAASVPSAAPPISRNQ